MSEIHLEDPDKIVNACLKLARDRGDAPLSVVVLDPGGHIIVAKRSDGSGILRHEIAFGKACGALGIGCSAEEGGQRRRRRRGADSD